MTKWTCKGKGGTYVTLTKINEDGTAELAKGAGTSRDGELLVVYMDLLSGKVYYRTADDFSKRMRQVLECPDCETRQCMIDMIELGQAPG